MPVPRGRGRANRRDSRERAALVTAQRGAELIEGHVATVACGDRPKVKRSAMSALERRLTIDRDFVVRVERRAERRRGTGVATVGHGSQQVIRVADEAPVSNNRSYLIGRRSSDLSVGGTTGRGRGPLGRMAAGCWA